MQTVKIKSIKRIEPKCKYELEVADNANFFANGEAITLPFEFADGATAAGDATGAGAVFTSATGAGVDFSSSFQYSI